MDSPQPLCTARLAPQTFPAVPPIPTNSRKCAILNRRSQKRSGRMSISSKDLRSLCIRKSQRRMSPKFEEAKLRNALSRNFGLIRPLDPRIQTFVMCNARHIKGRGGTNLNLGQPNPGKAPERTVSKKKPYTPPSYRFERVFELNALSCGKVFTSQGTCKSARKTS
jgi:hypothetical protein